MRTYILGIMIALAAAGGTRECVLGRCVHDAEGMLRRWLECLATMLECLLAALGRGQC